MAGRFKSTNRQYACEICGNTDGRCSKAREGKELWNCYHFTDRDSPNTNFPGGVFYKYIGEAADPLWAKWLKTSDSQEQAWKDAHPNTQKTKLGRVSSTIEAYKAPLALSPAPGLEVREVLKISARNQAYKLLLDALTLAEVELEDLVSRGIDLSLAYLWGFRSLENDQVLPPEIAQELAQNPALPGIDNRSAAPTVYSHPGCLCPVKDHLGRVQTFQVRLREDQAGGRYRWLTSPDQGGYQGASSHLSNGELPLAVVYPVEAILEAVGQPPEAMVQATAQFKGGAVALVEGTGAKPFLTSQRLGIPVVGSSGGAWADSPQSLQAALSYLEPCVVVLCPDGGSISNHHVLRKYQATCKLLESLGHSVRVAWWEQLAKGTDADEIAAERLVQAHAEPLNLRQYWQRVKGHNLFEARRYCLELGISPEVIPAECNRRLSPGPVQLHSLRLIDLTWLRDDLADQVERNRLVLRLSRQLRRAGASWATIETWLTERKFTFEEGGAVDMAKLRQGRWPKTKELRGLTLSLGSLLAELASAEPQPQPQPQPEQPAPQPSQQPVSA